MGESLQHARLVDSTERFIRRTYGTSYCFSVLNDLQAELGADKPPTIEGFVPDIYAHDTPVTVTVIGEAKTAADLENEHTEHQLHAFLRHLESQPRGVLILSVPWQAKRAAFVFVKRCWRAASCCKSEFQVLDDVDFAGLS